MLVPIGVQTTHSGEFQTVMVTLPGGPSETKIRVPDDCVIQGGMLSMHSGSNSDSRSWVVRSPSISGWETLGSDMEAQWMLFMRKLALIYDRRCFPPGSTVQSIRSEIVKRIPLPANSVPIFMYSDQGEDFVDLAPDMEITIQTTLSPETSVKSGSGRPSVRILNVTYEVVSRHDNGVSLRRSRGANDQQKALLGMQDRQILTLDARFARTSVLRLFLQGFSHGEKEETESHPILVGASDATQLEMLTNLIWERDPVSCVSRPETVCLDLARGSVSLLSLIWVNGHRTTWPFGTSLASLLFSLPQPKQAQALESVQVSRQLSLHRYAGIEMTRTMEGARQLLLLPGDRVEWKD